MKHSGLTLALSSDANYLDGLAGTLAGAARCTQGQPLVALIMDSGIPDADWADLEDCFGRHYPHVQLQRVRVDANRLSDFNPDDVATRFTNSIYARLLIAELAPEFDRVIYLDSDLYIDADLRTLFATPLDGALIGAVREQHLPRLDQNVPERLLAPGDADLLAFNSGVMLMDLAGLRAHPFTDRIRANAAACHGKFQDQAMLNYVLIRQWKELPLRWNRQRFVTENFSIYRDYPASVWHFIGKMKPWHFAPGKCRGIVEDFQRNLRTIGWRCRFRGEWHPRSAASRDSLKAARAFALRSLRTLAV